MIDVRQFLPPDDDVEPEVERILRLETTAYPIQRRRGAQFLPTQAITLVAFTVEGQTLQIKSHVRGAKVYTEIQHKDVMLREFHTHDGHNNPKPANTAVSGPHVHFPSKKYPLVYKGNTYAYCVDYDWVETAIEGVHALCAELDILIDAIQDQIKW